MSHAPISGTPQTLFTPSASTTGTATAAPGASVAMPAVDANNQQLVVTNNGAGLVTIHAGSPTATQATAIAIQGGTSVLIDDPAYAAATSITAATDGATGFASITVQRGTTSASLIFNRAPV